MKKVKVGIIGTGNIGTDLLVKVQRSDYLECGIFTGRSRTSEGIQMAKALGVPTSTDSIKAIEDHPDCCEIVFDATSANAHPYHNEILKKLGKFVIDLTPARIGKLCVPAINLEECLQEQNVNLITCGGQATIPIAYAISQIHPELSYLEIVASIASRSAGLGTRNNIDEFTQTTRDALEYFTHVKKAKAIITLNPAYPPIIMRNTIYAQIINPRINDIERQVRTIEKEIQKYVPGYTVILGPLEENGRITTIIEVVGLGDFLPRYSGNLDIITCAAVRIAEAYARKNSNEGEGGKNG